MAVCYGRTLVALILALGLESCDYVCLWALQLMQITCHLHLVMVYSCLNLLGYSYHNTLHVTVSLVSSNVSVTRVGSDCYLTGPDV